MLAGFSAVLLVALCLALLARRVSGDPKAFFAARGQLGTLLFFLLSVGETYSIGSILGFPGGLVASRSVDTALWFIGYILLACPVGMLLYPKLWSLGRRYGAITLPDFLGAYFESPLLARVCGCLLVLLMLPLGTTQFIGLSAVLATLGLPLSSFFQNIMAAGLTFLFVGVSGLRGTAVVSVLKDALILLVVFVVAFASLLDWNTHRLYALSDIFRSGNIASGSVCTMLLSTVIIQAFGFCIAPQTVASVFSAKNPEVIRRAQVWMPIYMLLFPLLFVSAGYGMTHDMSLTHPDRVFLDVSTFLLPSWLNGIVLGGIALTALVWIGAVCLGVAAIVTRNIVPNVPETAQKRIGLMVVVFYLFLSVVTSSVRGVLIVTLNRLFFVGLIQLLPAVLLCVSGCFISVPRLLGGIATGLFVGMALFFFQVPLYGLSPAVPALFINFVCLAPGCRRKLIQSGTDT